MPHLPPVVQVIITARNQAESDTACTAGPQVATAVAVVVRIPTNPNPNGLVGLTRRELPHQRQERLIMAWATRLQAVTAIASAVPAAAARGGGRGAFRASKVVRQAGVRESIAKAAKARGRGRGK